MRVKILCCFLFYVSIINVCKAKSYSEAQRDSVGSFHLGEVTCIGFKPINGINTVSVDELQKHNVNTVEDALNLTTISGTRDSGKTTLIKELVPLLDDALGVISDKVFDADGVLIGYDCVLVPSGTRHALYRVFADNVFSEPHGRYYFDKSVYDIVSEYIISNYSETRTIVIDEIGNLEMRYHRGYYDLLVWLFNQESLQIILSLRG